MTTTDDIARFHQAVADGNIEVVERLLAIGVNGDDPDWDHYGHLALLEAARLHNLPMVQALLGGGCSVNVRDSQGRTALHVAVKTARVPNAALVNVLLNSGADVMLKETLSGMTPLHALIQHLTHCKSPVERAMYVPVLRALLEHCDVDVTTNIGETALHLSTMVGNSVAVVKVLLEANADTDAQNVRGETPLMNAIAYHQDTVAKFILDAGCDVNLSDRYQQTALHYAANTNSASVMQVLLQKPNCNVNAVDLKGDSALHLAAGKGYGQIIKILLDSSEIQANLINKEGKTPLSIVQEGSFYQLQKLFPPEDDVIYRHPEKLFTSVAQFQNDNTVKATA